MPVMLAARRDRLECLRIRFQRFARNLVVLRGGMNAAERDAVQIALCVPDSQERLVLAIPISWRGMLAQCVGRLHREHQGKGETPRRPWSRLPRSSKTPLLVVLPGLEGGLTTFQFKVLP